MNATRSLALTVLILGVMVRADGRANEIGVKLELLPLSTTVLESPVSGRVFELPGFAGVPQLSGPSHDFEPRSTTRVSLGNASPVATKIRFIEPHSDALPEGPLVPARTPDVWLMLLVTAFLVAHQLRRKQRRLNHPFCQ